MRDFLFNYEIEIITALIISAVVISFIYLVIGDIRRRIIKSSKLYFVYSGILLFTGILIGIIFGFFYVPLIKSHNAFKPKVFWQVWDIVADNHYKSIDKKKIFHGALKGIANSTEDKHRRFLTAEERVKLEKYLPGKEIIGYGFDSEGCYQVTPAGLQVLYVFHNSPAAKLGIGPGDIITSIDDCQLSELMDKLQEPGVHTFQITKFYTGKAVELILARENFKLKGVLYWISDDNIAYIRISAFEGDIAEEFEEAVESVLKENPKGLILDLRGNPGGEIDIMLKVADAWLPDKIIQISKYPSGKEKEKYAIKSKFSGKLSDVKTVVLVNKKTASASEVLVGALKYYFKEMRLVGERTYGKAVAQGNLRFTDGSYFQYTVCEWLNPGYIKFDKGIKPDYEVKCKKDSLVVDCQLDKAMEVILQ